MSFFSWIAGVTYLKNGGTQSYSSVQDLIEKEQLDILYPEILPEGLKISDVLKVDDMIIFRIDSQNDLSADKEWAETYIAGELEFNVHPTDEEGDHCTAFAMHDGNLYTIETKEYSQLTAILDELGKGTLQ